MNPTSRILAAASSVAIGLCLALQPLSVDFTSFQADVASALAKGGDGHDNGGGNGGGRNGGSEGRSGDSRGHGGERGDRSDRGGHADRGHSQKNEASSRTAGVRGSSESQHGRAGHVGIIEGFLADLRGQKATRSGSNSRSHERSKSAKADKNGKTRETARTTTSGLSTTVSAASLGRLNAAHASPNALAHASPNSTVGRIGAYKSAIEANDLDAAAKALAGVANKEVTADSIKALNDQLGVEPLDADKLTALADKVKEIREEPEPTVATTAAP